VLGLKQDSLRPPLLGHWTAKPFCCTIHHTSRNGSALLSRRIVLAQMTAVINHQWRCSPRWPCCTAYIVTTTVHAVHLPPSEWGLTHWTSVMFRGSTLM